MRLVGQTIYYRVKEVDLGGKFEYSRLVSVVMDQNTVMTIMPNPVAHQADVNISFEWDGSDWVSLFKNELSYDNSYDIDELIMPFWWQTDCAPAPR